LPQREYPLGQAEAFVVDIMTETLKAARSSATTRILDMTSPPMGRRLTGQAVESSAALQASVGAVHLWLNPIDCVRRRM
jgi:hypothetical protein